jgi:D-sedoheptulose 7-phosphate isomerase
MRQAKEYSHLVEVAKVLSVQSSEKIEKIVEKLKETFIRRGRLFVCGNGGSSSIALHLVTDLTKIAIENESHISAFALGVNPSLSTMISNDYGFEFCFELELKANGRFGDTLLAISSSGNSKNILNAVKYAESIGMETIGLVGFDGGNLVDSCKICLHVESQVGQYALVEDVHATICHDIAIKVRDTLITSR